MWRAGCAGSLQLAYAGFHKQGSSLDQTSMAFQKLPTAISIASHSSGDSQPSGLECSYRRGKERLQHPRHLFEDFGWQQWMESDSGCLILSSSGSGSQLVSDTRGLKAGNPWHVVLSHPQHPFPFIRQEDLHGFLVKLAHRKQTFAC